MIWKHGYIKNKRPMGHIAQLINSFNPIITFAEINDFAIILRDKNHNLLED